ncbi:hypothetical protein VUR80DRAFT_4814 [Thermomyces stellatus]
MLPSALSRSLELRRVRCPERRRQDGFPTCGPRLTASRSMRPPILRMMVVSTCCLTLNGPTIIPPRCEPRDKPTAAWSAAVVLRHVWTTERYMNQKDCINSLFTRNYPEINMQGRRARSSLRDQQGRLRMAGSGVASTAPPSPAKPGSHRRSPLHPSPITHCEPEAGRAEIGEDHFGAVRRWPGPLRAASHPACLEPPVR